MSFTNDFKNSDEMARHTFMHLFGGPSGKGCLETMQESISDVQGELSSVKKLVQSIVDKSKGVIWAFSLLFGLFGVTNILIILGFKK